MPMNVKELEVPVPWGHISIKARGSPENTPVLAIHGIGDSAGSFDRIMPFLPDSFYYLCIDLPGHGKSSPYPPYVMITTFDNILSLKMVVDYLNREKYILMGHSWGGQTIILFTQLYPQCVLKVVAFDSFHINPCMPGSFRDFLTDKIDGQIRINKNVMIGNKQPTYTQEEAIIRFMGSRMSGELSRDSAEGIVKRSLIPDGKGKFKFTTDPRLRAGLHGIAGMEFLVDIAKRHPITCPLLFVYATELQYDYFKPVVDEFQKMNETCVIQKVMGTHDVHNNNPEIVGPIVSKFLLTIGTNKL